MPEQFCEVPSLLPRARGPSSFVVLVLEQHARSYSRDYSSTSDGWRTVHAIDRGEKVEICGFGRFRTRQLLRDTLAALEQLPEASSRFRKNLPARARPTLARLEVTVRQTLLPIDAHNMVPGRDPQTG
jgi:hypothetical protein